MDRQIDRRILLSADGLRSAGWTPEIIAMPCDGMADQEAACVTRIQLKPTDSPRESLANWVYKSLRARLGTNRRAMRFLKRIAWSGLIDQETYYERIFWPSVRTRSPDIIVAIDLPMLPVSARLAEHTGAKLVYDSHELYSEQDFSEPEKRRWREIESKYIAKCDAVITINESIASELKHRYQLAKVHVILNAERNTQTQADRQYFHHLWNLETSTRILLYQGGLSRGRNLDVLTKAMSFVHVKDLILVVLGNGEMTVPLRKIINRYDLGDRVFLHPAVPQGELLRITSAADVGVIPYQANCLNNYYCTPNKLFEFIAAGIPVLASELPELTKFVSGWRIGLVGDTSTPEHTAHLIDEFFADGKRLEAFRHGVEKAKLKINWETEEKKLISIFESLS